MFFLIRHADPCALLVDWQVLKLQKEAPPEEQVGAGTPESPPNTSDSSEGWGLLAPEIERLKKKPNAPSLIMHPTNRRRPANRVEQQLDPHYLAVGKALGEILGVFGDGRKWNRDATADDAKLLEDLAALIERLSADPPDEPEFKIDKANYTVTYGNAACSLGDSIRFKLLERLHRSRGTALSYETLREGVWGGARSKTAA